MRAMRSITIMRRRSPITTRRLALVFPLIALGLLTIAVWVQPPRSDPWWDEVQVPLGGGREVHLAFVPPYQRGVRPIDVGLDRGQYVTPVELVAWYDGGPMQPLRYWNVGLPSWPLPVIAVGAGLVALGVLHAPRGRDVTEGACRIACFRCRCFRSPT